jgi:hypothetical protein
MTRSGPKCRIKAGGWAVFLRASICSAANGREYGLLIRHHIYGIIKGGILQLFCAPNVGDGSSATVSSASEDLARTRNAKIKPWLFVHAGSSYRLGTRLAVNRRCAARARAVFWTEGSDEGLTGQVPHMVRNQCGETLRLVSPRLSFSDNRRPYSSMCRADRRREQAGRSNASRMGRWRIAAGNASEGWRCARPDDRLKLGEGRGRTRGVLVQGLRTPSPCNRGQLWRPEGAGPLRGLLVDCCRDAASSRSECRRCEPQGVPRLRRGAGAGPMPCFPTPLPNCLRTCHD